MLLLIEFSMYQIFWVYIWCISSMVWFHVGNVSLIGFCVYCHWFHIQYNYCSKTYLLLLHFYWFAVIFILLIKKSMIYLINLSLIGSFSFFSLKRLLISLTALLSISFFPGKISYTFSYVVFFSYIFILSMP